MFVLTYQNLLGMCDTYGIIKVPTGGELDEQLKALVEEGWVTLVEIAHPISVYRLIKKVSPQQI